MRSLRDQLRLTLSADAVKRLYPHQSGPGYTVLGRRVLVEIIKSADLEIFPRWLRHDLVKALSHGGRRIWLVGDDDDGASVLITGLTPRP